jgi:WD40 repeat protein
MGDGNESWRARLATEVRLIDRRTLCTGGVALLVLAAIGAAAKALGVAIAGPASTLASMAMADLGLVLLAVAWLTPNEPATQSPADEALAPAPDPSAAVPSSDVRPIEVTQARPISGRRKANARAAAGLTPAEDKRSRELALFAGRGRVPTAAIEVLWASQGMSAAETERLLNALVERSIVQRGDDGAFIVAEPSGATGADSVAGRKGLAAAHGRLVDGYRSRCPDGSWWRGPNDGYFFENIAYHLAGANRTQELNRLLLDYDWLRTRLAFSGIIGLLADFADQPPPADVEAAGKALELSAPSLAARPERLGSLLADRLGGLSSPGIDRLLEQIRDRAPRPWICQLTLGLPSPGGSLQRALPRHDGAVRTLTITPDGSRLVTGGDDHTIRIWNLASGRLERTLQGHADSVRAVAVTPDGRRIVSGGTYDVVRVWDFASGQFEHTIAGQAGCRAVYTMAVTGDGKRVVLGGAGAVVQVWDLVGSRVEHTFRSGNSAVRTVAITPDGRFALSGGDGGTIQVWDLETGRPVRALNGYTKPVLAMAVTPDGRRVVSGGHDNTVQVWDIESGLLERTLWGHTGPVDAVAITPDGRRIVSGGLDRKVRMWDLSGGEEIAWWKPTAESDPEPEVTVFCPIPTDPSRVAYGDSTGSVQVLGLLEA